jgi:hypothetical protein
LADIGIDATTIDTALLEQVWTDLGILYIPYDVHAVLNILEAMGQDTSAVNQTAMYEELWSVDWDNFVLDRTAIEDFILGYGFDASTFDQTLWE